MSLRSYFFKSESTEKTMKWLEQNYKYSEGVCLPRCLLYSHYLDFCRSSSMNSISAAAFGKIIRRLFNKITTRRLGTRGQSKYHYYGLAIRKSSQYYPDYLHRFKYIKKKPMKINSKRIKHRSEHRAVNLARKIISNFPNVDDLSIIYQNFITCDMENFLYKCKNHYDQLVMNIINFKLSECALLMNQFWLLDIHLVVSDVNQLASDLFIHLIEHVDYLLYEAIIASLIPRNGKEIISPLMDTIKTLASEFENWLKIALVDLPLIVFNRKMKVCQLFTRQLKRYSSLLPLVKNCSCLLNQRELLSVMMSDINYLDLDLILNDLPLTITFKQPNFMHILLQQFYHLDQYSDMDKFIASLNHNLTYLINMHNSSCIVSKATKFVLNVNHLIICIDRELTLSNVTTLNHWIKLLTIVREWTLLVAEESIRKESFASNKVLVLKSNCDLECFYEFDDLLNSH